MPRLKRKEIFMYKENNDIRTPRDRVSEDDLARYLLRSERKALDGQNDRSNDRWNERSNNRWNDGWNDRQGDTRRDRQGSCACNTTETRERESCSLCRGSRTSNDRAGHRAGDCSNFFVSLGAPLAAVYSPIHVWRELYDEHHALSCGTLFAELDKPLEVRGRKCK